MDIMPFALRKLGQSGGEEVTDAIKDFFDNGRMLREVNSSAIASVPKVPIPTTVNDYRPFSCCTTLYKCIAKLLANRIKEVPPDLLSLEQNAFVSRRRIVDNVLLAQELLRNYHRNNGSLDVPLRLIFGKLMTLLVRFPIFGFR